MSPLGWVFSVFNSLCDSEDCVSIPALTGLVFLAGPYCETLLKILCYQMCKHVINYPRNKLDTVNKKIFMYKNIHVQMFLQTNFRECSQNILMQKLCQVEITVHVLLIKRLLATHTCLFCYRDS